MLLPPLEASRRGRFAVTMDVGKAARVDWVELVLGGKWKFVRFDKETKTVWLSKEFA